jgi:DNA-binding NarL/FixJ family response regulator
VDRPMRVLVANRPKLMREVIIETFVDQPDVTIVGEVSEEEEILSRVDETRPDFLFIALNNPMERPAVCDAILRSHPEISIFAVAEHANQTMRYWASFNIHASVVEASGEAILSAMRSKASRSGERS